MCCLLLVGCGETLPAATDDLSVPQPMVDAGGATDTGGPADLTPPGPCPDKMALVPLDGGSACIDKYEGALVEITDGGEKPFPHFSTLMGKTVRAVPADGIEPQGYISQVEAQAACMRSGKRLCTLPEWMAACQGPMVTTYPYGNTYVQGRCNEGRATNPVNDCFGNGAGVFTYANMNDPCCDMQANGIAKGGAFAQCVSAYGVFDMHGNRHEWIDATAASGNGIFKGGFFVDAKLNFPGCNYRTIAHAKSYHDYSTGFRCCANPR
jgi:formylglycine-generating enzyme